MNWFQVIAALYLLGLAVWVYLCDNATPEQANWTDL